jgi:hypothetical protein
VRFASRDEESGIAAPLRAMTLESSEVLEGSAGWLRYKLEKRLTHLFARRKPGRMRESRRDPRFDIKPLCLHAASLARAYGVGESLHRRHGLLSRAVTFAHCWPTLCARLENEPAEWRRPWARLSATAINLGVSQANRR